MVIKKKLFEKLQIFLIQIMPSEKKLKCKKKYD